MKKYIYDEELIKKCVKGIENGENFTSLANKYGVNRRTLAKKLNEIGVKSNFSGNSVNYVYDYNEERFSTLVKEYKDGKSLGFLAKKYGISTNSVKNCLKVHNVEFDSSRVRSRNIEFNINKFEKIDSEEKAYWLGFMYADGYVCDKKYTIELQLQEKDYDHVVKFANFLELDTSAIRRKTNSVGDKKFISYRVSVRSKKMFNDLVNLGCIPRKSLIIKYPKNLGKRYMKHFIRGVFDGDGTISHTQDHRGFMRTSVSFLGTKDLLDGIANFLHLRGKDIPLKEPIFYEKSNVYCIRFGGSFIAERIYKAFYKNSSIYLDRKRDKFFAVLKHNRRKF